MRLWVGVEPSDSQYKIKIMHIVTLEAIITAKSYPFTPKLSLAKARLAIKTVKYKPNYAFSLDFPRILT